MLAAASQENKVAEDFTAPLYVTGSVELLSGIGCSYLADSRGSAAQIRSTVDVNNSASGELGPWRGQEQYGMGDFLGSSDSPERALMADVVTIGPL